MLAEREIATERVEVAPPPPPPVPIIVLSEEAFGDAVHDALRDFAHPDTLRANLLLRSRLILDRVGVIAGEHERVHALQQVIQETAESLQLSPRQAKLYRALYYKYFQPAPTQERAAEILDLPFSTFRRHLKAGVMRVTEILWQREIGALDK
jgi:hypothetical protein